MKAKTQHVVQRARERLGREITGSQYQSIVKAVHERGVMLRRSRQVTHRVVKWKGRIVVCVVHDLTGGVLTLWRGGWREKRAWENAQTLSTRRQFFRH